MMARIRHRLGGRFDWRDLGAVLVALLIGGLVGLGLWQQHDQQSQITGLSSALDKQRDQVKQLGKQPVAPPASKVRENPDAPIPTPTPSATAVGPSDGQVYAAVAAYCGQATKPCQPDVPVAQIAAAAVNYLRSHPAPAGPKGDSAAPPTAEQLGAAVASFCGQGSDPCRGPKGDQGEKGDQGPGPTADQLGAAVRDYVAANPLPTCPDGTAATAEQVLTTSGPVDAVICVRS